MRIRWPRAKSSAVASVTQRLRPGASTNVLAALDLFGDAAIIVDREWRVVFQNNVAARRSGTITVEAVNAQLWQAWPAASEIEIQGALWRAAAGNRLPRHSCLPP